MPFKRSFPFLRKRNGAVFHQFNSITIIGHDRDQKNGAMFLHGIQAIYERKIIDIFYSISIACLENLLLKSVSLGSLWFAFGKFLHRFTYDFALSFQFGRILKKSSMKEKLVT